MRHYHKRIEINLYTGGRNTYDHSKLIIYPDIDGRVGYKSIVLMNMMQGCLVDYLCQRKRYTAINLTDKESENWLTE